MIWHNTSTPRHLRIFSQQWGNRQANIKADRAPEIRRFTSEYNAPKIVLPEMLSMLCKDPTFARCCKRARSCQKDGRNAVGGRRMKILSLAYNRPVCISQELLTPVDFTLEILTILTVGQGGDYSTGESCH